MTEPPQVEPGSFRDPESRVFYSNGRVLRALSERALADWNELSSSGLYDRLHAEGRLVGTELLQDSGWQVDASSAPLEDCAGVLAHEAIPFVSYPYEWPFAMLRDAALLQLDLELAAIESGMALKDATPYNVQFRGAAPVFVDLSSFERLREGRPWIGYRQFCMQFLYSLFLRAYRGAPYQPWLRGSIEGISPDDCRRLLSSRDRLRRGVFTHVYLHSKLERRHAQDRDVKSELREAGFSTELVRANVRKVRKVVERLSWTPPRTAWTEYGSVNEYDDQDVERKSRFVADAAREHPGRLVWDLGCNDGRYSRVAAEHAGYVVAIDSDEALVDRLYRELSEEGDRSILPLTMNLGDPSPGLGWRGSERKALTERARPELTLCLALLHHVSITGNVPVADFVRWLAELGSSAVIEFVTPEDPMAELLLSRKEAGMHADYDRAFFERRLEESFQVARTESLCEGRRLLYYARPRAGGASTGVPSS